MGKIFRFWVSAFSLLFALSPATYGMTDETVKSIDGLPPKILESQDSLMHLNVCEKSWGDLATELGVRTYELNKTTRLWFVPCALWAVNLGTTAYVTVKESSHPEGFVTLPLRFANFKEGLGWVGQDQVYNMTFNPGTQILESSYNNDQTGLCGTKAAYLWNQSLQSFKLIRLYKKDTCRDAAGPWHEIDLNP